jgi:hypothetical protein
MIKAEFAKFPGKGPLQILQDIYKSTPAEEMQKMWDELPEDKKIAPKREYDKEGNVKDVTEEAPVSSASPEPIEEAMSNAPANSDDMFDDSVKKEEDSTELF